MPPPLTRRRSLFASPGPPVDETLGREDNDDDVCCYFSKQGLMYNLVRVCFSEGTEIGGNHMDLIRGHNLIECRRQVEESDVGDEVCVSFAAEFAAYPRTRAGD